MKKRWYALILSLIIIVLICLKWTSKAVFPEGAAITIKDPKLREVSGLVYSVRNAGLIWMHNDSGRGRRFFLVDTLGNTRAVFKWGEALYDWEDIALGTGPVKGISYLYAGDIGDNFTKRPYISVYRIPEPRITDEKQIESAEKFILKYPDGPRDAEAMLVDPLEKKLYLISKREANPGIYSASLDLLKSGDTVLLKKVGKLHIKGIKMLGWVTAADISRDGKQILVRTYGHVFYWKRNEGQTVEEALQKEPKMLNHIAEIQGEAIGFTPDGKGYYTVQEGKNPFLNYNRIAQ